MVLRGTVSLRRLERCYDSSSVINRGSAILHHAQNEKGVLAMRKNYSAETLGSLMLKGLGRICDESRKWLFLFCLGRYIPGLRVMTGVKLNGARNVRFGKNCYIGRNVILDASAGDMRIGDNVEIRDNVRIYANTVMIGDQVTIGEGAFLNGKITIESGAWIARGCDISGRVFIEKAILGPKVSALGGGSHHRHPETGEVLMSAREFNLPKTSDDLGIRICKGSWIGHGAILLKNLTIFPKAIVGAGSVVTTDVSGGAVVAGNPARPIKSSLSFP